MFTYLFTALLHRKGTDKHGLEQGFNLVAPELIWLYFHKQLLVVLDTEIFWLLGWQFLHQFDNPQFRSSINIPKVKKEKAALEIHWWERMFLHLFNDEVVIRWV